MITVLFVVFFLSLLLSVPVVFALALGCAAALLWHGGLPGTIVPQHIVAAIDSSPLLAIPLFILFGELVSRGSIGRRLVALCEALVGWARGGLAHANILASMFFGGISGAATADTAAVGSVMIPEMKRRNYPAGFAAIVTCTSSVMGNLIPPSIDLILYAWLTGTPVDQLFAAGLVPGIFIGLSLMAVAYLQSRRHGYGDARPFAARRLAVSTRDALPTLLLPAVILGGIFTGMFTVTESAAVAFAYGLILTVFIYRDVGYKELPQLFRAACITIGSIMLLLATAKVFGWILTIERVPQNLSAFLLANFPSQAFFAVNVIVLALAAGCFLTPATALIILTPILHPIAMALGFDPLHFGVLLLSALALGHVTPPVGLTLFIGSSLSGVPIDRLIRPLLPFLAVLIIAVLAIAYLPAVTLTLPQILGMR